MYEGAAHGSSAQIKENVHHDIFTFLLYLLYLNVSNTIWRKIFVHFLSIAMLSGAISIVRSLFC
jgi:hypothetical protein